MRVMTAEQLDARLRHIMDCSFGEAGGSFRHPLTEYKGKTLNEKIAFQYADETRRLQSAFQKIKNPTPAQIKVHDARMDEVRSNMVSEMSLARRHRRNQNWINRMQRVGGMACLSMFLSLCGGVASISLSGKESQRKPATMVFGAICAISTIVSWGCLGEENRLSRSNRRIQKELENWHTLNPAEKEKIKQKELYSVHMGLIGFLETFQHT